MSKQQRPTYSSGGSGPGGDVCVAQDTVRSDLSLLAAESRAIRHYDISGLVAECNASLDDVLSYGQEVGRALNFANTEMFEGALALAAFEYNNYDGTRAEIEARLSTDLEAETLWFDMLTSQGVSDLVPPPDRIWTDNVESARALAFDEAKLLDDRVRVSVLPELHDQAVPTAYFFTSIPPVFDTGDPLHFLDWTDTDGAQARTLLDSEERLRGWAYIHKDDPELLQMWPEDTMEEMRRQAIEIIGTFMRPHMGDPGEVAYLQASLAASGARYQLWSLKELIGIAPGIDVMSDRDARWGMGLRWSQDEQGLEKSFGSGFLDAAEDSVLGALKVGKFVVYDATTQWLVNPDEAERDVKGFARTAWYVVSNPDKAISAIVKPLWEDLKNGRIDKVAGGLAGDAALGGALTRLTKLHTAAKARRADVKAGTIDHLDDTNLLFTDAEIDDFLAGWDPTTPKVKGKATPRIDGRRVPTKTARGGDDVADAGKQQEKLDIQDIPRRPGESARDALARVRLVVGKKLDEIPELRDAWNAARREATDGIEHNALTSEKLYKKTRRAFWRKVSQDDAARAMLERSGIDFPGKAGTAPHIDATPLDGGKRFGTGETQISLDHVVEQRRDWTKALDADNLEVTLTWANSHRETVQMRHPDLRVD